MKTINVVAAIILKDSADGTKQVLQHSVGMGILKMVGNSLVEKWKREKLQK